ncbi:MAG: hypothetical protein ABR591_06680 [Candidatus Velthaea sp.]
MKALALAAVLALATLAAAPPAAAVRRASVVCLQTPLFLWPAGESRPQRAGAAGNVRIGDSFAVLAGPRATLDGFALYELDMRVAEPGYRTTPDEHYWIDRDCVSVTG